jgi:lauroyl/myristoyl acyltransferase
MPDLQRFINSSFSIDLVAAIGRSLPLPVGLCLADFIAGQIARQRNLKIVRAVRANQWIVSGRSLSGDELDRAVRATFQQSARVIFHLYHYLHNPEETRRAIVLDDAAQKLLARPEFDQRGLIVAGLHISSFDLGLQSICEQGLKPMILTLPDPRGSQRKEYERRRNMGMNLVPTSVAALRQALKYLERGGLVLTGVDRPIPDPTARPLFFGQPSALPVHHIFLATKARVPIVSMASFAHPDGSYHVHTSEPIEMEYFPDHAQTMLVNAERVLKVAETYIKQAPHQWTISLPVWPQLLDSVPN